MKNEHQRLRDIALDILLTIGESGGFSHLVIDQKLKKSQLELRDKALLTELVYGTMQHKLTLQYYTNYFVKKPEKMKNWVKWLFYLSIYQMEYLEKIPDHAIIHESVEIAKNRGHKGIANLVNGVLRTIQRNGLPDLNNITDPIERLSIQTSHPYWLVKRWFLQFGEEITREMCETNTAHKQMSIRVQPLKIRRDELMKRLENDGIHTKTSPISDQGMIIEEGNVLNHETFQQHFFTVQDESSMLVAELMDIKQGMTILDSCSAPGGKTTHIAEKMQDNGEIYAYDLHEKKAKLVAKKAKELDLTCIQVGQKDARKLQETHSKETFDRILVDAPCSGLGVLRSKPDIRYNKKEEDIHQLARIQKDILTHVLPLLKKDGKLVYSTCTVDKEENEQMIQSFLDENPEYKIDSSFFEELPEVLKSAKGRTQFGIQIFPQDLDSDGFFITRIMYQDNSNVSR